MGACIICGGNIPFGRHKFDGKYCSKKCESDELGFSEGYKRAKERAIAEVKGVDSWLPSPLDPILRAISAKPIPIFSDIHFPLADSAWLEHALKCAKHWESEVLILNGDIIDANQISRHAGSYKRRKQELEDDMAAAEYFLRLICSAFKQVIWLSGNHDIQRLIQVFKGELGAQRVLKMMGDHDNLKVTSRSFVDVNDRVRVCHPRQYSRNRGVLAQKLAQRWQMHIATGHQHHAAMSYSPDGKWQAVDIPAMCRTDIQDYVRNELNDYPEPMTGFGAVFGNFIQVFTDHTRWEIFGLPEKK